MQEQDPTNLLWYYLGLYIMVMGIRFFKIFIFNILKKEEIDKGVYTLKKGYVHISLEIVYSAAGFVILLSQTLVKSIGPIIIFYAMLIIFSTFLDFLDEKHQSWITASLNIAIIIFIFGATTFFLGYKLPDLAEKRDKEKNKVEISIDTLKKYKLSIPFVDNTMKKHVGADRYKNRCFLYITEIKAKNDTIAKIQGLNNFQMDEMNQPVFPSIKGALTPLIKIDTSNILISEIKNELIIEK